MRPWGRFLTNVLLAIALIVAGQGRIGHAHASFGVSTGQGLHCQDPREGAPPVDGKQGTDCALCKFCGGLDALAPPALVAPPESTETRTLFVKSPWRYPRQPAQAQRARAPPLFG